MNYLVRQFEEAGRHASIAKIVLAPAGVLALIYWASQQRALVPERDLTLLILGAVIALISILPFALRFRKMLAIVDLHLSNFSATRILTQSMFYYFFVPLSVGTELSKFAKLQHMHKDRAKTTIATAIVLDHFVGLAVLLMLSIGLYIFLQPIKAHLDLSTLLLIGLVMFLMFLGFVLWSKSKPQLNPRHLIGLVSEHRKSLCIAAFYSTLMHLLIAAAVTAGALYWEINISYFGILFVLTGAFLFQMIPINLIGVSALEIAGAGLYLAVGLSVAEALMLVSLLYCYRILIALVGGAWEFFDAWTANR